MTDCFCGCGRGIGRFPLGLRSINKRGALVAERFAWAWAMMGAELDAQWVSEGLRIIGVLQLAMHGASDPRLIDESEVRRWQMYGAEMEALAIEHGGTPIIDWLMHEQQAGRSGRTVPGVIE